MTESEDPVAGRSNPPGWGEIGADPDLAAAELRRALEAILIVADEPMSPLVLGQLLEIGEQRAEALCDDLARSYERERRGFCLAKVAGGYRVQSHSDLAAYVERFVLEGQSARLSAAALETLAIIAYRQPISRAQVALIRGVNAEGVVRTLVQRGYVAEVARDPGPGQAALFGTTALFLESLGLHALADLPPIGDFVPGPEVMEVLEASLGVDRKSPVAPRADPAPTGAPPVADDVSSHIRPGAEPPPVAENG